MSSAEEHGGRRPAVAHDAPVAPDQVADMGTAPETEEYEPVDPDPEAVIDEAPGGPDVDDGDDAYPHERPEAPDEGIA